MKEREEVEEEDEVVAVVVEDVMVGEVEVSVEGVEVAEVVEMLPIHHEEDIMEDTMVDTTADTMGDTMEDMMDMAVTTMEVEVEEDL